MKTAFPEVGTLDMPCRHVRFLSSFTVHLQTHWGARFFALFLSPVRTGHRKTRETAQGEDRSLLT